MSLNETMAANAVTENESSIPWSKRLISKQLNKRQMWRVKCVVGVFLVTNCIQFIVMNVAAQAGGCVFEWQGQCYEQ